MLGFNDIVVELYQFSSGMGGNKKRPIGSLFILAAQVKLNANEIIAEIINIAETLTDADIALCAGDYAESAKAANMSAFYIPNHTLTE